MDESDDRDTWLWVGGASLTVAVTAAAIGGGFAAVRSGYELWTSAPFLIAYGASGAALVCLIASVRHWVFPLSARSDVRGLATGLSIPFVASPGAELEATVIDQEIHPFEWKAIVVEAKVQIINPTGKTKHPGSVAILHHEGANSDFMLDMDVMHEVERHRTRRQKLAVTLDPHGTTEGWVVFSMPHQPRRGAPAFQLTFRDELGDEYKAFVPQRGQG